MFSEIPEAGLSTSPLDRALQREVGVVGVRKGKVELPEPLGDRELFDGGEYPPRPATVYEEPTVIGL